MGIRFKINHAGNYLIKREGLEESKCLSVQPPLTNDPSRSIPNGFFKKTPCIAFCSDSYNCTRLRQIDDTRLEG